ncbi:hypothetical protein NLG97_g4200 [Lecanicillium saksenae]|uniref:Uncharacterized protein n=1 Tax=Lecanicillium saksenae TaxID=468837 RepID=A0ACC1QXN7_9HYPO|nr:hypothetical protein NLG97_g4200 [Lecanicillium saksenae]
MEAQQSHLTTDAYHGSSLGEADESVTNTQIPYHVPNAYDDNDSALGDDASIASSSVSLTESIYEHRALHGRTYQVSKTTEYWGPNDEEQNEGLDLAHALITMLLGDRLFEAPLEKAPSRTLQSHKLEHLLLVNQNLRAYDTLTSLFDLFIQIDSEDTEYVYIWRAEQEDHLRLIKGDPNAGMTQEQVVHFVDGYYPAYELYTDGVRSGIFSDRPGCQLRMVVGRDRSVKQVMRI